jgi:CRISPR-associated protein Cmr5
MSAPQTFDQRRAKHAWAAVSAFAAVHVPKRNGKPAPDEAAKKFGTQARKLPIRIMASGLGQALAFLVAKGYCSELLQALNHWVLHKTDYDPAGLPPADALLREVVRQDSDYLRQQTAEALAYLQWLIRFAEAEGLTDSVGD